MIHTISLIFLYMALILYRVFSILEIILGFIVAFLSPWQAKVDYLAGDDYRSSVLEPIKEWIRVRHFCILW